MLVHVFINRSSDFRGEYSRYCMCRVSKERWILFDVNTPIVSDLKGKGEQANSSGKLEGESFRWKPARGKWCESEFFVNWNRLGDQCFRWLLAFSAWKLGPLNGSVVHEQKLVSSRSHPDRYSFLFWILNNQPNCVRCPWESRVAELTSWSSFVTLNIE